MTILGIDHVGIAVRAADDAQARFGRLTGWGASPLAAIAAQQVRVCFLPAEGASGGTGAVGEAGASGAAIELLEPLAGESTLTSSLERFLDRRGEGVHHVCFAVDDIEAELRRLQSEGFELIDTAPRPGHGGLVAFLHPRAMNGVLVELLQRTGTGSAGDAGVAVEH